MTFSGKVGNGPFNKRLIFGGDPDHRLGVGIVFRIRRYMYTGDTECDTALRDAAVHGMH